MGANIKLDVRVYPITEPKNSTLAFANVGIGDAVAISGIRVVKGSKGNFVAMPQSRDKDGNYHDIVTMANDTLRKELNKAVLCEFGSPTYGADGQYHGAVFTAQIDGEIGGLDAKVYPIKESRGNTLAFAGITIDNLVEISGVRVVSSEKGNFVAMPQSQDKNGGYHDIAFPINSELRREINDAVLDGYDKRVGELTVGKTAEKKSSLTGRLADSKEESAAYNAAQKANPAMSAAKKSPTRAGLAGLED